MLLDVLEGINKESALVIFRGQAVKGNLLPSIARKNFGTIDTTEIEMRVFKQLGLLGASFNEIDKLSKLDLMVMAQHFGLKTRLLDWTSNPLIALWFACTDKAEGDAYLYALDTVGLLNEDINDDDIFKASSTRVFQPKLNNHRIVAQDGWFTLHKFSGKHKKFIPLEKVNGIKENIVEFKIPAEKRLETVTMLNSLGINRKSVFRDIEGLCHFLNEKYEL